MVGDRISVFDFTMAGMLSGCLDNEPSIWLTEVANEFPAPRSYLEKIQQEVGVSGR